MKNNWIVLSLIFIWCIFMGITGVSIGLGAVFPSMNRIAKPFVCPRGEMQLETQTYTPTPIETVKTLTWYCVDNVTGEKVELGLFPMSLYAGVIYGFLLFVVIVGGYKLWTSRLPPNALPVSRGSRKAERDRKLAEQIHRMNMEFTNRETGLKESQSALSRMKELKEMRNANLISETEYEQKRAEILKDM